MTKEEKKTNKPFKKARAGNMTATIWKNEIKAKDGNKMTVYSVNLEKSYKDKDDEWQKTNSLNMNDLPKAILVLQEAYKALVLKEKKEEDSNEDDTD